MHGQTNPKCETISNKDNGIQVKGYFKRPTEENNNNDATEKKKINGKYICICIYVYTQHMNNKLVKNTYMYI